ncbi:MAG: glycosyltransferase family 9 protein [Deltaproteobacteria bacterium]|nr:glycosyltransferase family 9 protein [Deltaproteobacteria bacterium]
MTSGAPNILIVKYSSLGDVVNAVPAVNLLRRERPKALVYWLLRKEYAGLISANPCVDGVIVYERGGFRDVVKKIRALKIDVAIDLQGLFKSGLIGYLSGAKTRVSFPHTREGSSVFYTQRLGLKREGVHAVMENLSVIEEFTGKRCGSGHVSGISLNGAATEKAALLIGGGVPFVAVSPTSRWRTKMWGQGAFTSLADMLIENSGVRVFFTGADSDRGYIEGILKGMKHQAINLAGRTDLKTLAGVFRAARLVVSCDSGSMHLASAVGAPVVAVFGPTDPRYTGPFGKNSLVVTAPVDCSPCRKRNCGDMKCMARVTPEMVFDGARRFLGEKYERA